MDLYETPLGRRVLGCAIEVHSALGPGLLESMYERCCTHEFMLNGLSFRTQVALPIQYKGLDLGLAYRVDFVVEDELVVELKAVDYVLPVHKAQLMTYLRVLDKRQGFLINFNVRRLVDGVTSILNPKLRTDALTLKQHPQAVRE